MPKLYGQAAYQGQQDDDDPMPKSKLKRREEKMWRDDWVDEQFSIKADEDELVYHGQSTDQWNAMVRRVLPERLHYRYLIPEDVEIAKKDTYEGLVKVDFSYEDCMYVATAPEYPEFSYAEDDVDDAILGLRELVHRYNLSQNDGVEPALSDGWL